MSQKKIAIDKILESFTREDIKRDQTRKSKLIIHEGALKEAVLPVSERGIKRIRQAAKGADIRLLPEQIESAVVPELEGLAWDYDDAKISPVMRYAQSDDGTAVILDLCNDKNQVVEIKGGSVQILDTPPASNENVYFTRSDEMLPMVTPVFPEGDERVSLNKLRPFIHTDDRTFFILLGYITYLMSHPKSRGLPYPILMIQGDKGSGKSFFCNNVIRNLIDPVTLEGISLERSSEKFHLSLNCMYMTVFDNLRSLTKAQSDLLCKAATKASAIARTKYTDTGITGFSLHSPMVLNGIHDFVKESDLADRCFRVGLMPMSPEKRRTEQELTAELNDAMPEILGALLALSSKAMAALPDVKVVCSSRMMDFVLWLAAIEKVWSMPEGLLQKAYRANVRELMADGMGDDSLTLALQKLIKKIGKGKVWKGTPSKLLDTLQAEENPMYLPKAPGALSTKLFGQESSLNANGVYIKKWRGAERMIAVAGHQI
ncbi:ATP-binding protein [Vibrio diabolicus]|uniref:ATP-binding protein n=1 Tax=Vibrio diabolicus TaxID=50719 RepID=UPI0035A8898C